MIKGQGSSVRVSYRKDCVDALAAKKLDELFERIYAKFEPLQAAHGLLLVEGTHEDGPVGELARPSHIAPRMRLHLSSPALLAPMMRLQDLSSAFASRLLRCAGRPAGAECEAGFVTQQPRAAGSGCAAGTGRRGRRALGHDCKEHGGGGGR